jgi:hypothetical protein
MGNPDRIRIWTNLWLWIVVFFKLKWWFRFGDFIMDRIEGSHKTGDFKFRRDMIIIWLMLWACIIVIVPDQYEFFPFMVVLWGSIVFSNS